MRYVQALEDQVTVIAHCYSLLSTIISHSSVQSSSSHDPVMDNIKNFHALLIHELHKTIHEMALSQPRAILVGVFLETIVYGIYLIVFAEHMSVLYKRNVNKRQSAYYLIGTSLALIGLITAHVIVEVVQMVDAFSGDMSTPNAPQTYFDQIKTHGPPGAGIYAAVTLVADAFLVYRCFVVWGNNYVVIILPFLTLLADMGLLIWAVYSLGHFPGLRAGNAAFGAPPSISHTGRAWYGFCATLILNLMCTALIVLRIRKHERRVSAIRTSGMTSTSKILAVVIESASIYSIVLVPLIGTSIVSSEGMFLIITPIVPIIGIVFSSIIVRVDAGLSKPDPRVSTLKFGNGPRAIDTTQSTRTLEDSSRRHADDGVMHIHLSDISSGASREIGVDDHKPADYVLDV